jgi:hypothetical protein
MSRKLKRKIKKCRECGCTNSKPCFDEELGYCWWSAPDLCSHCDPAINPNHKNNKYRFPPQDTSSEIIPGDPGEDYRI